MKTSALFQTKRLVFCLIVTPISVWCQLSLSVINEPRPIAALAEKIERTYGVLINYEDPPYLFAEDVSQSGVGIGAAGGHNILIPKPKSLSLLTQTMPRGLQAGPDSAIKLLTALSAAYEAAGLPGSFTIAQDRDVLTIMPKQSRDGSGVLQNTNRVLDTAINIESQSVSAMRAVEILCSKINAASGMQAIEMGTMPANVLAEYTIQLSASNEMARSVLARILATTAQGDNRTRRRLVWQMFYGPDVKEYVLNVHVAQWQRPEPTGKRVSKLTFIQ